jgi:hypothetical protein
MVGQMKTLRVVLAVMSMLGVGLSWANDAFAWGGEGHRVIADIAEQYVEPDVALKLRELLAIENDASLAEVSTWADEIRRQERQTAPWHYVNIPIHPPPPGSKGSYEALRDCANHNCVVAQISDWLMILQDNNRASTQRLQALKFVVHFVGDVHQPLHCSNDDDRGGNDIHVNFNGRMTNLHAVWDTAILAPVVGGDERGYALRA